MITWMKLTQLCYILNEIQQLNNSTTINRLNNFIYLLAL